MFAAAAGFLDAQQDQSLNASVGEGPSLPGAWPSHPSPLRFVARNPSHVSTSFAAAVEETQSRWSPGMRASVPLPGGGEFTEKKKRLTQIWGLDLAEVGEASEASALQQTHLETFLIPSNTFDFPGSEDWSYFRRREVALW